MKHIYKSSIVVIALAMFALTIIGMIYYKSLPIEKEHTEVESFYIDNCERLYLSTNKSVLCYEDKKCIYSYEVYPPVRISVIADTIEFWDTTDNILYVYEIGGELLYEKETDNYNTEPKYTDSILKNGKEYRLSKVLGFTTVKEDGKIIYHTPILGYVLNLSTNILFPVIAIYLAIGYGVLLQKLEDAGILKPTGDWSFLKKIFKRNE